MTVGTRANKRIERITGGYNGLLGLQGVPRGLKGLRRVRRGYIKKH